VGTHPPATEGPGNTNESDFHPPRSKTRFSLYDRAVKKPATKKAAPKKAVAAVAKKAAPEKPKRLAVRVSVNQIEAEPMHVLGNPTRPPEVGDVLKVLPDRLQSTVFAKTVKVERITTEGGVTTIYAATF
jgi:hypothetical protein